MASSTRPPTAARAWPAKLADGGLRSYASMTYAGLKSMIYAGLDRDDPRVKAALTYITPALLARRKPRPRPARALLLLPYLRQDDGRPGPADPGRRRRESRMTGGPTSSRPWPSGSSARVAGSTPPTGSWKATPTWSRPMRSWLWPIHGRMPSRECESSVANKSRSHFGRRHPICRTDSYLPVWVLSGWRSSSRSMRNLIWLSSSPE